MTPLGAALRKKFKTPREAIAALGLDARLLEDAVVVGDSNPTGVEMAKPAPSRKAAIVEGALFAFLRPKLAQDAKVDFKPILANVTDANFAKSKGIIVDRVKKATAGKLAQDADIGDLVQLLNGLEGSSAEEVPAVEGAPDAPVDMPVEAIGEEPKPEAVDHGLEELKAFLVSKGLSDEDLAKVMELMVAKPEEAPPVEAPAEEPAAEAPAPAAEGEVPAKDNDLSELEAEEEQAEEAEGEEQFDNLEKKDEEMVTKPAMDAAIAAAVAAERRRQKEIRAAEEVVRPVVGKLIAQDSAEGVYRAAFKAMGKDVSKVASSALPVLFAEIAALKKAKASSFVAMDASVNATAEQEYYARFPHARRLSA